MRVRAYTTVWSLWTTIGPAPSESGIWRGSTSGMSPARPTSTMTPRSNPAAAERAPIRPISSWMVDTSHTSYCRRARSTRSANAVMIASAARSSIAFPTMFWPSRRVTTVLITGQPGWTPSASASAPLRAPTST